MTRRKKSGTSPKWFELSTFVVSRVGNVVPRLGFTLSTFGLVIGHRHWLRDLGCRGWFASRESLWRKAILPEIEGQRDLIIAEFGVAYGEATRWWLTHLSNENLRYFGFDRFTGLPRSWRNMPEGAFDAGGRPPEINDSRVVWQVGDAQEQISQVVWGQLKGQKFIIFDLDLFEPSLSVWEHLRPYLSVGDILYFDGSFDHDERTLVDCFVRRDCEFEILGASPLAVAMKITKITI